MTVVAASPSLTGVRCTSYQSVRVPVSGSNRSGRLALSAACVIGVEVWRSATTTIDSRRKFVALASYGGGTAREADNTFCQRLPSSMARTDGAAVVNGQTA